MTPDEVLEHIDHAVDDWSVSDDAMRWLPEPEPHGFDEANRVRVYVSTDDRPFSPADVSGWTELGHTVDGATFTVQPRIPELRVMMHSRATVAPVDLRLDATRTAVRELLARLTPGIQAAAWQINHMAEALQRIGSPLLDHGPLDHSPEILHDPDRRDLPLRLVGGRDAQQSPYGPKPRGRR